MKLALQRAVLKGGRAMLGDEGLARLAARLGREPGLSLDGATPWLLEHAPQASVVPAAQFVPAALASQYDGLDPNRLIPGEDVPSVHSFVPYYRGSTNLLVYNFFRMNYGIRDPVLYRYAVYAGRRLHWCHQFLLGPDRVAWIPDPCTQAQLPQNGTVVLQAFHPRIATPSRQLRYFVLYRKAGVVSGTHSLQFDPLTLARRTQPSYRAFGEPGASYGYHVTGAERMELSAAGANGLGALRASVPVPIPGYITRESAEGAPLAIWHDGPTPHYLRPAATPQRIGASYTGFFIPDFARHAPRLLLSTSQIGFLPRRVTLRARAEDGRELALRTVELPHDDATVDVADVLPGLAGPVNVIVEFDRDIGEFGAMPTGYIHIYYRGPQGASDQVHSHHTLGVRDDPFRRPRPYRCRKFAPYVANAGLEFTYSIVNLGIGGRPVHDDSVRVRIFTEGGAETVRSWRLSPSGFTTIRAAELGIEDTAAVVQFEHETTNFNGSWYAIDRHSGHLAADHFTGG